MPDDCAHAKGPAAPVLTLLRSHQHKPPIIHRDLKSPNLLVRPRVARHATQRDDWFGILRCAC